MEAGGSCAPTRNVCCGVMRQEPLRPCSVSFVLVSSDESTMRGFVSGLAAGVVLTAVTNLVAAPAIVDLVGDAQTGVTRLSVERVDDSGTQRVNRTAKGDRLDVMERVVLPRDKRPPPQQEEPRQQQERILAGCEPVVSPLSVSVSAANVPRHCVAGLRGPLPAG